MSKRRNWLWIIFGVFFLVICVGIGMMVAAAAWVQQNMTLTETTEGGALQEFDNVRSKYSARPPLLELRDGRPVYTGGKPPESTATPAPLDHLHVLLWDPDENKLGSFSVPFWLLRMKPGRFQFSSYADGFDDDELNMSVEDLERHGPGIVLDTTSRNGERVLVWAQ